MERDRKNRILDLFRGKWLWVIQYLPLGHGDGGCVLPQIDWVFLYAIAPRNGARSTGVQSTPSSF
jgi:hypothetical protein